MINPKKSQIPLGIIKLVNERGANILTVNKCTPFSIMMMIQLHHYYLANDPGTIGVKKEKVKATKKNPGEQMLKYKC